MRLASFGPWAHRYVFFNNVFFFKFTTYSRRHTKTERKSMRVHSSQRRPTQAHEEENGPNDARRIVWAGIGKFFLMYFFLMYNLSTKAHEGPQQPAKADAGPQRWKTAHRSVFLNNVFFKIYNLFTKAHEGPQQPTKLNAGPQRWKASPQRPTSANEGRRRPGLNSIIDLTNIYLNLRTCMQPVAVPMVYPWCTHTRSTL